ncbi:DUF2303 family protein [Propionivibrio sp.]|uniref:DUF2303 family protein n=1 Tax=Propionivibrio sp. TaxID=2212460 RepID=UPI003BF0163B
MTEAQTILDAGASVVEIRDVGGIKFAIAPDSYSVINLEKHMPSPVRNRGAIVTSDSPSFIDYLNKYQHQDASKIYAEIDSDKSHCKLVAVLDDHTKSLPGWREHTCTFSPKQAVEWTRWIGKNQVKMTQSDFASWLEDNLPDIATVAGMPTGAEILSMALGFEANSDKKLRSKVNLQSGGFTFEFVSKEDERTRATMQVFERFTIGIPVFDGSANAYPLESRLKYREKDGVITFWYELIRPDRVFKTAVTDEVNTIKRDTNLLLIYGSPGL